MLSTENPDSMLASGLLVISQLARTATSKHQIERFIDSGVAALILPLLEHPCAGVRARTCNLLGNLCRYSDALYPQILHLNMLGPLIKLCCDKDRSTRKFACFAIGNAGFHSDALYHGLRPAVPLLVELLHDEEDKTRANAAGALGNLVRNSGYLVPSMIESGAVESLLDIVMNDIMSEDKKKTSSSQIALFSLGNLAAHSLCAQKFQALKIREVILDIETNISDPTTLKYAHRVAAKLEGLADRKSGSKEAQQTPMR